MSEGIEEFGSGRASAADKASGDEAQITPCMPVGEDIWELQSGFSSYSSTNNEENEEPSMVIRTSNEPRALPETLAGGDTWEHLSAFSSFSSGEGEGIKDTDISSNKTEIPFDIAGGQGNPRFDTEIVVQQSKLF